MIYFLAILGSLGGGTVLVPVLAFGLPAALAAAALPGVIPG